MNRRDLIWDFQEAIIEIYKEYELSSIRGLGHDYNINGRQVLAWHSEVTRKSAIKNAGQFHYYRNFQDLVFCSDELLYFTAHLFLYRPFLNNPIEDSYPFSGRVIYPNFQNLEAKRYNMFADITSQKAYNYWDRIGDMIASLFPDCIKPHNVFFPTAVDAVPEEFRLSPNFLWLKNFKENEYSVLNRMRKQIVHYITSDTEFNDGVLKIEDEETMQEYLNKREALADFYKNHIKITLEGLEKTLLFFEELNPVLFAAIT